MKCTFTHVGMKGRMSPLKFLSNVLFCDYSLEILFKSIKIINNRRKHSDRERTIVTVYYHRGTTVPM